MNFLRGVATIKVIIMIIMIIMIIITILIINIRSLSVSWLRESYSIYIISFGWRMGRKTQVYENILYYKN